MTVHTVTNAAPELILAASGSPRWVAVGVENGDARFQYDGGEPALTVASGDLIPAGGKLLLEGGPAGSAIYAIATNFNARLTVQTGAL